MKASHKVTNTETHEFHDFGDSRGRSDVSPVNAAAAPEAAAAAGHSLVGAGQIDGDNATRHFRKGCTARSRCEITVCKW